jgi:hypothetical protein
MTEEYLDDRERELLDYFRNNTTDYISRSTNKVDTFVATSLQTEFTLTQTLVKNVRDTLTVDGVTKYKGEDFTVAYGEGAAATVVTLNTGAVLSDSVVITYTYGSAIVEREFSRTDTVLPRIVMMFLTGSEEFAGLGDSMEDGVGSYINASYRIEIRDKYASRARRITSICFNLGRKLRHAYLHRIITASVGDLQNFDYDVEKACYIWQFTLDVQWDSIFQ